MPVSGICLVSRTHTVTLTSQAPLDSQGSHDALDELKIFVEIQGLHRLHGSLFDLNMAEDLVV